VSGVVEQRATRTVDHQEVTMSINNPNTPTGSYATTGPAAGPADTHQFGDVQVSTGRQSAYVTVELIPYVLATLGIFLTAAVIDERDDAQGFSASDAWFYVTLLTVGFLLSRGLAKLGGRNDSRVL
jgi:hypothetical protein